MKSTCLNLVELLLEGSWGSWDIIQKLNISTETKETLHSDMFNSIWD